MAFLNCFLGKDELIIDFYLKNTAAAGDKSQAFNQMLVIAENFGRRTDGP